VAASSVAAYPEGVWFVDLSAVKVGSAVPNAIALAIGVSDQSTRPALEKIIDSIGMREVLLILDNCEHLLEGCAQTITSLLRQCSGLRILATSRAVLGVDGEHVFAVSPLSTPDPEDPSVIESLLEYESVGLLVERAGAVVHGFAVTDETAPAIARLCARLDGLPLAIELAASRLRSLPIEVLVERLEDRFSLLTGGSRSALPRQRTLRALIDWSYDICSPEEKLLWSRLSVFADSFSLDAAEGVCADDELATESIIDTIDSLVGQSIITMVTGHAEPRYRMLETIRRYGWERLVENGEDAQLERRHFEFFFALTMRLESRWFGPGQEADLARLRADHGNLRVALEWGASDSPNADRLVRMVAALRYHWCSDGFLSSGRHWIDRVLARSLPRTDALLQGLIVGAWITLLQGERNVAEDLLTRAEDLARELGDGAALAELRGWRGTDALFSGDLVGAEEHFAASVEGLTEIGHPERALMALFQLSDTRSHLRDPHADESARQGILISEQLGERWTKSYALWSVGLAAWVHERLDHATTMGKSALAIQQGFNDHVGSALMIELMAWIAASQRDFRRSAVLLGAISAIWQRIGTDVSSFGPHLAQHHAQCEAAVTSSLPAPALKELRATGEAMHLDQAIEYALDFRGLAAGPAPSSPLTPRESDIAELVALGLTNKVIAQQLVLSTRTVDSHVQNILGKLELTSRAQVAVWVVGHRE
jgi:predicted ATPase/DNA-binding NarL/FixJ family response regulator